MHHRELTEGERVQERRPPEPAPLPLHALLRMQQGAGNQATVRMLAREKYTARQVHKVIAMAQGPGITTADALVLAVYNEIRLELDPDPGVFGDIATAEKKLLELNKIEADDIANFRSAAEKVFPAAQPAAAGRGGKPKKEKKSKAPKVDKGAAAEALKAQIDRDRGEINRHFGTHVLKGAFREDHRPSGFHTINGGSPTHEAFGKKTTGEFGTYRQSVREIADKKNVKETQSTFFPDSASADEVIDAMTSVYGATAEKGRKSVAYPDKLKGMPLASLGLGGKSKEPTIFPGTFTGGDPGEGFDDAYKPKRAG